MKNLNKIASLLFATALGQIAMTSCEDSGIYEVNAPDWLASRVDSIKTEKEKNQGSGEELENMKEDVYTIGATDFTSGWWAEFSKYYVIPEGETWNAQFNLNINPAATNTYKNFALIITNDDARGGATYREYGAIRFDNQPSGNSEWGDFIDRSCVESSLTFNTDTDAGVDKLGGLVTLTVDRSNPDAFTVRMTNGTVTKTYSQKSPLVNLNADESNTNIRAFLVPEGSFINFLATNLEPIGGCTDAVDKMPLSMTLKGLPKKVLLGTEMDALIANVTAVVEFEQAVSKTVSSEDLTFQVIPDLNSLGVKTLVAAYNLSYKGEFAQTVLASCEFEVVDKMYTCLGNTDNTTGWWGAHSDNIKVNPNETRVVRFTNYTTCANNWNNWVIVLCQEDNTEYSVARADNWSWGPGWEGNAGWASVSGGQADWDSWRNAMDGAKVTMYVSNNGDGTADVKAVMLGTNGETYYQDYLGLAIDPENFYFRFTVDGCHLEWDNLLGAEDNSTGWWGAHSDNVMVPAGMTYTESFVNHTTCANNWNNWVIVLCQEDNTEYAVARADNWSWGPGWEGNAGWASVSGGQADWDGWRNSMDGAKVTISVANYGDGTADVKAVMVGTNGETYYQDYLGLSIDPGNFYYRFTVDGCHLVFE